MSATTLSTEVTAGRAEGEPLSSRPARPARKGWRGRGWWISAAALAVFSMVLLRWARTSPGYDPYGWLVWGYQTLHLNLDLGGAPSWKPLPSLFTVPYSLFGHYSLWLWGATCVALSLAGAIFAGRIAYTLTVGGGRHRYAALAGGLFAGLALVGMQDYAHYVLSVQSDSMIVGLCLGAVDCHLCGRRRWAFWLLVLASFGRPEAWVFCGVYGVWLWRRFPALRRMVCGGLAAIPLMWFGVPLLTGQSFFVSGQLAYRSPRALHENRIVGELGRFFGLEYLPVWLASATAVVLAMLRGDRAVLTLAGAAVLWLVIELAFVLHGWPGVPRYVMEPAGVAIALGGVAVGWILAEAPRLARGVPRWLGVALVALLAASLAPGALARLGVERADLHHERQRTQEIARLKSTIARLGGYRRVRSCGEPVTDVEYASVLAWFTKLNVGFVGYLPDRERAQPYPIVLFTPVSDRWIVQPWHTLPAKRAQCARLGGTHVAARGDPVGALGGL